MSHVMIAAENLILHLRFPRKLFIVTDHRRFCLAVSVPIKRRG